jgi:hypothetical protein
MNVYFFAPLAICLSACVMSPPVGHSGSSSGAGGETATGSNASSGAGGDSSNTCGTCPDSPSQCHDVECIADSCLLVLSDAGKSCYAFDHPNMCNGGGVCAMIACETTADCGAPPPCFNVSCEQEGVTAHTCTFARDSAPECGLCAPIMKGKGAAACDGTGAVPFLCVAEGGPRLGAGACTQPNPETDPLTWCCNVPTD